MWMRSIHMNHCLSQSKHVVKAIVSDQKHAVLDQYADIHIIDDDTNQTTGVA